MAEWLKAPVSKTGIGETLSRVQISPSPHAIFKYIIFCISILRGRDLKDGLSEAKESGQEPHNIFARIPKILM